mgnify:CR=1 FL=1
MELGRLWYFASYALRNALAIGVSMSAGMIGEMNRYPAAASPADLHEIRVVGGVAADDGHGHFISCIWRSSRPASG